MHPCLNVDEIIRLLVCELVGSGAKATAVSLSCCCRTFEDSVLDVLWETQVKLSALLKCFPQEVWSQEMRGLVSRLMSCKLSPLTRLSRKSFERVPTKEEWARLRKYARRMKTLEVHGFEDPIAPEVFPVLQLRTANELFLPRLQRFQCEEPTTEFIPFIPLFLSPRTIDVDITFAEESHFLVDASIISRLPTLCPELECITLRSLLRTPIVIAAVSEMLLACNRDSLQSFSVNSPLTEEAQEVLFHLPKLSKLWTVFQGGTKLPSVTLPNLTTIDVEYDDSLDWLEEFRGVALGKLESISFHSGSEQIGDFLGAFESVALTTSAQNTLSSFSFYTSRSWNPNYSSLLSFKQLQTLEIEFDCRGGCSSRVDDEVITALSQAMPKLEVLRLGGVPCGTSTGATFDGLVDLSLRCPRLTKLHVHFHVDSLIDATVNVTTSTDGEPIFWREDCALTDLEVGNIPIPPQSALVVTLSLLQIFPRILNIVDYTNPEWETVAEAIKKFRQVGTLVHRR